MLFSLRRKEILMIRRKDNKGRVLNDGESQRKDGRYTYQYTDALGSRKSVYSWKLLPADKMPNGKRKDLSLREKEKQIKDDLNRGIIPCGGNMTVLELVEKYVSQKTGVRRSTERFYNFVVNILKKDKFGMKRIDKIKISDAKEWMIELQSEGRGYSTIITICSVVRPAFQMAVEDDLLVKNPFAFKMGTVIFNDCKTRDALTPIQEAQFLEFVKKDETYGWLYTGIYILFHTGLRISELCGLTISDIDFKEHKVKVDHQLQRANSTEFIIESTKTAHGIREIPMTDEVYNCFRQLVKDRNKPKIEPIIGGKTGFLFLNRKNSPMTAINWNAYFNRIVNKYNKTHKVQMPKITPHTCRHTFCSNMAKSGMNPKILQYIMGHSDVSITLNTYTHVNFDNAREELRKLEECRRTVM